MQLTRILVAWMRSKRIGSCFATLVLTISLIVTFTSTQAEGEYLTEPELFLQHALGVSNPTSGMVWLTGEKKVSATNILGHEPNFMRLRYWGDSSKSAWIVDEIGKTEPITIGVVVSGNAIEEVNVLAFRESRGWEIKHDFFTNQFVGVSLTESGNLTQSIDGISGATLSVRAMRNVSRLILYLSQHIAG